MTSYPETTAAEEFSSIERPDDGGRRVANHLTDELATVPFYAILRLRSDDELGSLVRVFVVNLVLARLKNTLIALYVCKQQQHSKIQQLMFNIWSFYPPSLKDVSSRVLETSDDVAADLSSLGSVEMQKRYNGLETRGEKRWGRGC